MSAWDSMGQGAGLGAMAGPMGALIGGGAGLVKGMTIDKQAEDRDKKLRAMEQRTQYATGNKPDTQIHWADPLGSALQGGGAAMSLGQNANDQANKQSMNDAMLGYLNRSGGPTYGSGALHASPSSGVGAADYFNNPDGFQFSPWRTMTVGGR